MFHRSPGTAAPENGFREPKRSDESKGEDSMNRYTYPNEVRAALEGLQQPLAVYQLLDGKIATVLVSDGFRRLFGYTDREQVVRDMDHDMYKDTHPDDRKRIADAARRFAKGGDDEDYDVVFRTKAGVDSDYQVIHAHGKHINTEEGIRLAHVWYMDEGRYIEGDETAGSQMNRELNASLHQESILRAANYDALTGLPNLAYFFKLCEIGKARVFSEGKQGCLLYMDLNGMKYYNHRNGFAQGDVLLKGLAKLLALVFGPEDCCHIGADRFVVSTTEDGLEDRLNHFFEAFEQAKDHLPVRVGVYSTGMEDVPVTTAYDRAKVACDAILKSETSAWRFYTRELSEADKRRRYIQTNIDRAISEKWIDVYYQAIFRAVNEKVCDEEALARWIDPELGFLSPADFIPALEASGQIWKLDLYVLGRILEKINTEKEIGMPVVPHSVNLSRSDFETCDIVEEIRKRVDNAGVERSLINIEITESVIGKDFDYMKRQVERFRELGFAVWMDDFGSGYSSMDVLQSIRFDLIKFDMSFMRKLDENENARIVLTELMKLATSLDLDTVCEGVETAEQVSFLQEIGCSKLQGFHYSRPTPFDRLRDSFEKGRLVRFEDPETSSYYETVGRINLYDLDMITSLDEGSFRNSFNTIPIGIIEIQGNTARFVRCNPSYREFIRRFFGIDTFATKDSFAAVRAPFMRSVLNDCCEAGGRTFFNEKMPDGSVVHAFARRIGENPKNGDVAVAVAVLSISDPNTDTEQV